MFQTAAQPASEANGMNTLFGWPGGKKNMVQRLLQLLPKHKTYVEPFCGSARLLFAKPPSAAEVISDANGDLMNFFLVAAFRPSALAAAFERACVHPIAFKRLKAASLKSHDEVARAFRFAYLQWFSFGSKGEHFAWPAKERDGWHSKGSRLCHVRRILRAASTRLRRVIVDCGDAKEIIAKYDGPDTFFFCDPPYVNFQNMGRYEAASAEERARLFACLASIRGKFLMTNEDCVEIRGLARKHGFTVKPIRTTYTISAGGRARSVIELLISNYDYRLPRHASHAGAQKQ
jgi:DNA adenine methylase